ncbi:DUF2971 domain-containing protein [Mesorhizobium huakuii]|uniref:DUF2971 domain-containing protein n=1 Tax=Mesorhizobium huakuii TaxID=28104 RepID=A0A7G6T051_9HYPH|nr:DUF2971 domain-containing protein [Mesorhizobium huakuii]QND60133.1 DUF2971 domain-containing protein [Mesorhizobium huakuii]
MPLLYKYRDWKRDVDFKFVADVIRGNLWFPVASEVNDPFEFRCAVDLSFDRERTIEAFIRVEMFMNPTISRAQAEEKVRRVLAGVPESKIRLRQWEMSVEIWQRLASSVSMCSLSATPTSLLLWSHYGGGHKGIAVEIEPIGLEDVMYEVGYVNAVPILDPLCLDDFKAAMEANLFQTLFLRKSKVWEYEREYRIMKMRADSHLEKLRPGSVKRVIVGCAMPPEKRAFFLDWMKQNAPDVKVASVAPVGNSDYTLEVWDE